MTNQLDNLKKFSTIVADSGNIDAIRFYNLEHATTNPSLILQAAKLTSYHILFNNALDYARKKGGSLYTRVDNANDKLTVNIGVKILNLIPGHVSTEVDARLANNTDLTVKKAKKIISLYQEQNIDKSRVLIKIASTWAGIKAAEQLEQKNIHCNLTLLFSFAQAKACAESKVYLISPFVGRIYDWYHQHNLLKTYNIDNDPGVQTVKKIFYYYKTHTYNTIIMGASFRTTEQILSLAGCDYLTISPQLLKQLSSNTNNSVKQKLIIPDNKISYESIIPLSEEEFYIQHNADRMATEKLKEGIQKFSEDQQNLDKLLAQQL